MSNKIKYTSKPVAPAQPTSEAADQTEGQVTGSVEQQDELASLSQAIEAAENVESSPESETVSETKPVEESAPETPSTPTPEEVTSKPVVQETPAVEEVVAEEKAEVVEEQSNLSEEEQYIQTARSSGTVEQQRILAALETFIAAMPPRVILPAAKANAAQFELLQHFLWLLEKDYEQFKAGWNLLLIYFSVHHGRPTPEDYSALSEYNVARYMNHWNRGDENADAFLGLFTLLRSTRNKDTRKHAVKSIVIDRIGQGSLTEKALSNLKQFYGV